MRKLASIQKVLDLRPIKGADRIEVAQIMGWECVVKKGEFKVGDTVVYIEVDSKVPEKECFEFLRDRKFRVRTIKLKKQISQGLVLGLDILPPGKYKEGDDVSSILGVIKFDPQAEKESRLAEEQFRNKNKVFKYMCRYKWFRKIFVKGKTSSFPSFISKTDETRIQSSPKILSTYKDLEFQVTEKIDGCLSGRMLVQTDCGAKRISDIVNNKLELSVLSYNEELKQTEFKKVVDYHKIKANKKTYKIGVGHRGKGNRQKFVECTDNHKFFTENGWKRADELVVGEKIFHTSKNISSELKEIMVGCLLGDSSLSSNTKTGNYRTIVFNHSVKQKDYFDYKKRIFGNLFLEQNDVISGYGSVLKVGVLKSNLSMFNYINEYCMTEGKKIITEKFANEITPISLAFWFMDDGNLSNRKEDNLRCRANISSQGFSYEEHVILKEMFNRKFNIDVKIGDKEKYKGHCLIFDADNTSKLCSLIAPYVCDSMKYKLPKKYENLPCFLENFPLDVTDGVVETKVLSIEDGDSNRFGGYVYDLTVEDNHNYFANSILVHNCSGTYALKRRMEKKLFGLIKKEGFEFIVCSRNLHLTVENNSSYWEIARKFKIKDALTRLIGDEDFVILQGEITGEGIQSNRYKVEGYDFHAFNLTYPKGKTESFEAMARLNPYGIKFVPILDCDFKLLDDVSSMVEYSKGNSVVASGVIKEGVVVRNYEHNVSFKVINPDWLLKFED